MLILGRRSLCVLILSKIKYFVYEIQDIYTQPRHLYDMKINSQVEDDVMYLQCMPYHSNTSIDVNEYNNWVREDVNEQNDYLAFFFVRCTY